VTLKIEFEEQVWAQVIDMLAEHPYKRSGAIINTMAQQIQDQKPKGVGNGAMETNREALHQRDSKRGANAVDSRGN
jgi:hypothetical protein